MPIEERIAKISSLKLCSNCLRGGHQSYQCKLGGCRICHRRHNTLLHKQLPLQQSIQHIKNEQSTVNTNNNNLNTYIYKWKFELFESYSRVHGSKPIWHFYCYVCCFHQSSSSFHGVGQGNKQWKNIYSQGFSGLRQSIIFYQP